MTLINGIPERNMNFEKKSDNKKSVLNHPACRDLASRFYHLYSCSTKHEIYPADKGSIANNCLRFYLSAG